MCSKKDMKKNEISLSRLTEFIEKCVWQPPHSVERKYWDIRVWANSMSPASQLPQSTEEIVYNRDAFTHIYTLFHCSSLTISLFKYIYFYFQRTDTRNSLLFAYVEMSNVCCLRTALSTDEVYYTLFDGYSHSLFYCYTRCYLWPAAACLCVCVYVCLYIVFSVRWRVLATAAYSQPSTKFTEFALHIPKTISKIRFKLWHCNRLGNKIVRF